MKKDILVLIDIKDTPNLDTFKGFVHKWDYSSPEEQFNEYEWGKIVDGDTTLRILAKDAIFDENNLIEFLSNWEAVKPFDRTRERAQELIKAYFGYMQPIKHKKDEK